MKKRGGGSKILHKSDTFSDENIINVFRDFKIYLVNKKEFS